MIRHDRIRVWELGAKVMIRRRNVSSKRDDVKTIKGFDDFDMTLGDMMRGERATLGKSLLDVQRELRIKASYISAIENADPDAFDTPGFIAGYVRSYARYLNLDPEDVFLKFCEESGFSTAHGMSEKAASRKSAVVAPVSQKSAVSDDPLFARPNAGSIAGSAGFFSNIEPGAIGSVTVMLALVGSLGYGAWSILQEIQKVQVAPVENTPLVLSDLGEIENQNINMAQNDVIAASTADRLDRLYRPNALDLPILVSRDAPISTLDPRQVGSFAAANASTSTAISSIIADVLTPSIEDIGEAALTASVPQVVETTPPQLALFATREAWVQVKSSSGSIIFEKVMAAGEEYILPQTEAAPTLRAGMSGSIYFAVQGELYGPAGSGTRVVKNIALSVDELTADYALADIEQDPQLQSVVAEANIATFTIQQPEN